MVPHLNMGVEFPMPESALADIPLNIFLLFFLSVLDIVILALKQP